MQSEVNGIGISCFGDSSGVLIAEIIGGTSNPDSSYNVSWFDSNMNPLNQDFVEEGYFNNFTSILSNVFQGEFFVEVTDAVCNVPVVSSIEIFSNDEIINTFSETQVSCFGYSDGELMANPSSGVAPYTYDWGFYGTEQSISNLAPGAYSYLIIIDGVGLICTCLWRKQKKSERFLNETIAWYENHYPNLNRKPIKRVGGKGDFTINRNYKQDGRYYVGESGGLQDFMWGFGMRMAIWSGVLAAKDILGECDYEQEVRTQLMPYVRTSVANRWLMNRVGDGMFKRMCRAWMKDQKKRGDGLFWIGKLFKPTFAKNMLYRIVSPFMLEKDSKAMGRGVRRMPFRKAKKRDVWQQSKQAEEIGKQWDLIRRGGGKTSFQDDSDSATISEK